MTLKETLARGTKFLERRGILEAGLDAWYLLEHVTGISRAAYFLDSGKEMEHAQEAEYFEMIEKRGQRIPLQHLTGVQEFMGFPFQVNEHVLIPRQDTEILVEEALSILRRHREPVALLDMCTGSGCILLSILKLLCAEPGYVFVGTGIDPDSGAEFHNQRPAVSGRFPVCGIGADLSEKALDIAGRNAELLKVNAKFCRSDLFENVKGRFSMIVSNPPYIRTSEIGTLQEEVREHDPRMALDGGEDGLYFYRRIIREGRAHLLPGGYLLFEIGYDQAFAVSELMRDASFRNISVKKDLAGLDRVVSGVYDDKNRED